MTPGPPEPEAAVREHARRVAGGDVRAREDLAPEAAIEPIDLLEQLLAERLGRFELVAHARIGAHHVFKIRYVGSRTVVVQARWAQAADGRWRVLDAEVARVGPAEDE